MTEGFVSMKEPEKTHKKTTNETEIKKLTNEFKALLIRMITESNTKIDEHSENFSMELRK